jgi:hypothetical protein
MDTFIYNPCLLITIIDSAFRVVGMQTNDIIILGDKYFSAREEHELTQANYTTKPKEKLLAVTPLLFNSCVLSLNRANINLCQKG